MTYSAAHVLPSRRPSTSRKFTAAVVALTGATLVGALAMLPGSSAAAATTAGVPSGTQLVRSGNITVTKPGTVIDSRDVHGYIYVQADNVTIKRTRVTYEGYHSIRIFAGADGTVIEDSEVVCTTAKTNGIVFGNYTARRVKTNGCRYDFMQSSTAPATVVDSYIDGVPYSTPSQTVSPTASPSSTPTTEQSATAPETSTSSTTSTASSPSTTTPASTSSATSTTDRPTDSPSPTINGQFPNASTTGVPTGTTLTPSGSIEVTKDGSVIDAKHVTGTITVKANNVVIKRTKIDNTGLYPIKFAQGYRNLLVEDSEIDGRGNASVAILYGDYTLRRVNIHNVNDGPRIEGDNVLIEDSFIHDLHRVPGGHHDAIQIRIGKNIVIRNNNIQAYNAVLDDPMNGAVMTGSLLGDTRDVEISGNLMNGGNYTIFASTQVPGYVIKNNHFGRDYRYGLIGHTGPNVTISGNVWADTLKPIP